MNPLANVGFATTSDEEFYALLQKVRVLSIPVPAALGTYFFYKDASGAALYVHIEGERSIRGIIPCFVGKSRRAIATVEAVPRDQYPFGGALLAWAEPKETKDPKLGLYPFVFEVPDFYSHAWGPFPQAAQIQLTAFANEDLVVYKTEEALSNASNGPKLASHSFVPVGLFSENGAERDSVALLTGQIKVVENKTNTLTGSSFYWLLVETFGGTIDVVVARSLVPEPPQAGHFVRGQFWLVGKTFTL